MKFSRRNMLGSSAAMLTVVAFPNIAHSQIQSKPSKIVIGFAPGGGTDALARALAEALKTSFSGGIVVDNKAGASGRLAMQAVKAAQPDGTTLLFTPDFTLTVYPHTFSKLGYDPINDFVPVALAAKSGYSLCAGPAVPTSVKSPSDYIAWVKANPNSNSFGSSGAGTTLHFAGAMLEYASGVKLNHVPYKGGSQSMQDVMGGQIPVSINAVGEALPMHNAGRIRVLGTFGATRNPFLPNSPTMVESGFKDVISEAWLAFFVPPKTPADYVNRLASAINQVTSSAELRERFAKFGMETVTGNSSELAELVASDTKRWAPVIKSIGFKAEE